MFSKGFKCYSQVEQSDCGLVCMKMIANFYGKKVSLQWLRDQCDLCRQGITVSDIVNTFKTMGIYSVAMRLGIDDMQEMPLPAILFWNQSHFVVLHKIDHRKQLYHIADPAMGKVRYTREEFLSHYSKSGDKGIVVLAEPDDNFDTKPFIEGDEQTDNLFKAFFRNIASKKRAFIKIILFFVLAILADTASPFIFQKTIDDGIGSRDVSLVWLLVFSQLFLFFGSYVTNWISEFAITKLSLSLGIEMLTKYLRKLAERPMMFFERKLSSDLIQKTEDQYRIRDFYASMPTSLLISAITILIFSVLLIWFNKWIFLVSCSFTAISLGWNAIFLRKRREIDCSRNFAMAQNRNNLYEMVNGMAEIKANGDRDSRIEVWTNMQHNINKLAIKSSFISLYTNGGSQFLSRLRDITITGICATLVIKGNMTIGAMMTISYIAGRLASPLNSLINSIGSVQDAALSYERVREIVNSKPDTGAKVAIESMPDIKFSNVNFKYPGSSSPLVLKDLELTIPAGKVVAFVGNSGCGKSTVLKLIMGFYEPSEGSVTVGGISIADFGEKQWLSKCSSVMQSGYIFSDTILSNVALSDPKPDEKRAYEALKAACLNDFIDTLPLRLHTNIGVSGIGLSGGQTQRLLIARAIYKNSPVLLLDEATSSLDADTEARIVKNIQEVCKGRTVIIAAHRLSTIASADRIYYLNDGRISESGNHSELMELDGHYHKLVKRQLEFDNN